MQLLIVEDDENKRKQVIDFVSSTWPNAGIDVKRSLQSGLRAIIEGGYNLIILDMTLPTYDITVDEDGGRPQAYAGREILRQMDRRNLFTPVVVVTQFDKFGEGDDVLTREELDDKLKTAHPVTYRGMVYYNAAFDEWKQILAGFIQG